MLAERGGIVNVACNGETSWHGFATAIVDRMRARGERLKCARITPIATAEYPTKARRPANSRLSLRRLNELFSHIPPVWDEALHREYLAVP